jgi:uncharacterized membrane protein (UPF0127 family)
MQIIQIQNQSRPLPQPISAEYCDSFWSRFRGLMFRPSLEPSQALLLVDKKDNRLDSAIHMLFMNFDIAAVWINTQRKVVDVKLARKGQLMLIPQQPACYVLEAHTCQFRNFLVGDIINF